MNSAPIMMLSLLALASCAAKPAAEPVPPPQAAAPASISPQPACKVEGCCAGHGEVAYIQPDRYVMCTDGEASQICDCH